MLTLTSLAERWLWFWNVSTAASVCGVLKISERTSNSLLRYSLSTLPGIPSGPIHFQCDFLQCLLISATDSTWSSFGEVVFLAPMLLAEKWLYIRLGKCKIQNWRCGSRIGIWNGQTPGEPELEWQEDEFTEYSSNKCSTGNAFHPSIHHSKSWKFRMVGNPGGFIAVKDHRNDWKVEDTFHCLSAWLMNIN